MDTPELTFNINVIGTDFDKVFEEIEKQIDGMAQELSREIDRVWREEAAQSLHRTKDKYLSGLSVTVSDPKTIKCELTGFLPVALETGQERYDMKPGILGSAMSMIIPIGKSEGKNPVFRTMSKTSSKWFHPGFKERAIHKKVQEKVEKEILPKILSSLISRISI